MNSQRSRDGPGSQSDRAKDGRDNDRCRERQIQREQKQDQTTWQRQRQSTQTQRPRKTFSHVTELNKQILNSSDTKALWRGRGRDGPGRQTGKAKD